MIGFRELLIILLVVLVVFGGKRLPELGRGLGKGLSNFRKAVSDRPDAAPDGDAKPASPDGEEPKA